MSTESPSGDRAMRATVWRLFFCQALMNLTMIGQATMGALIGRSLSSDIALATLPMAIQMAGTMTASIPASYVFTRWGRRAGFLAGAFVSIFASVAFGLGVYLQDFWVYCLGSVLAGLSWGVAQHYRFAAAEAATPAYRPRAIALVMAGPVLSAILGPEIVKHTYQAFLPHVFLGTYMVLGLVPLVNLVLLSGLKLPPLPAKTKVSTPLGDIIRRPAFVTAVVAGMVAYGTMNLAMTATPLEMLLCGFTISDSSTVIQAHALAMFAPGFFTGHLIARFGVRTIIVTGALLTAVCVAVLLTGESFAHFAIALAILGLGWNFMFVGATSLQTTSYAPQERVKAQAANDFIVFGTVACTAFLSGYVHARFGWSVLNLTLIPPLMAALALLAWQKARGTNRVAAVAR
jgi:predicted MFS family arabinose efflux permease